MRHGGFGLRCQQDLAPLAYLGSLAQCLAPLRQAFPSLRPRIDALLTPAEPTLPSLEEAREALLTLQREGVAATLGLDVPYTWENVLSKPAGWAGVPRRLARAWEGSRPAWARSQAA